MSMTIIGDGEVPGYSIGLTQGRGNRFRQLGWPDAEVRQAKAPLAAGIIEVLDAERPTTRQPQARAGVALNRARAHPQRPARAPHLRPPDGDPHEAGPRGRGSRHRQACGRTNAAAP
jgi:hypothetical protein